MSRQEDFQTQAETYANTCGGTTQEKCATMTDYFAGAEYGYKYAVEKACEWLREHLGAPAGIPQAKSYNDAINELTTEFRKGMCNG